MTSNAKDQYSNIRSTGLFVFKIILFLLIILIGLGVYLGTAKRNVISVSFDNNTCLLEGDTFELKWIHSVEKQWWVEAYQRQGDKLLLTDTYFQTFGAGTPSSEPNNINIQNENDPIYQALQHYLNNVYDGYVHYKINTELTDLNWMISSNIKAVVINGQTTTNKQTTLPIYQWVADYTNIHITPKTLSLWTLMTQESCHDYTDTTYLGDTTASGRRATF